MGVTLRERNGRATLEVYGTGTVLAAAVYTVPQGASAAGSLRDALRRLWSAIPAGVRCVDPADLLTFAVHQDGDALWVHGPLSIGGVVLLLAARLDALENVGHVAPAALPGLSVRELSREAWETAPAAAAPAPEAPAATHAGRVAGVLRWLLRDEAPADHREALERAAWAHPSDDARERRGGAS